MDGAESPQNDIESESLPSPQVSSVQHPTSSVPAAFTGQGAKELLDRDLHYPYQRNNYISPNPSLSFESKRIMRQAQDPMYGANPRMAHFLYEVISIFHTLVLLWPKFWAIMCVCYPSRLLFCVRLCFLSVFSLNQKIYPSSIRVHSCWPLLFSIGPYRGTRRGT